MAKMTIQTVLERIHIAPKDSPLLILSCGEKDNVENSDAKGLCVICNVM